MIKNIFACFIFAVILTSCAPSSKIVYLNNSVNGMTEENVIKYANTLQPDDKLIVTVTADEPTLAAPFNLVYLTTQTNQMNNISSNDALSSYLIDQNGEIDFAGIGKIKLAGLTRIEAEDKIRNMIALQINNPAVNLRVINFKVSVIGEVSRPGTVQVSGDRITILEALSQAGDLTIYGKRKEVMVVREKAGIKTINMVDVTDVALINSPFYYLSQNDVVIVQPNQTRVNSSVIGPNLTVGLSAISLIVTIIALSTR
jgi:polysaccharide export outer membrane protein